MPNPYLDRLVSRASRYRSQRLLTAFQRAASQVRRQQGTQLAPVGMEAWDVLPPAGVFDRGPYLLGLSAAGLPVTLTDDDLNGLTLVVGPPAAGKSLLLERLMQTADQRELFVLGVDTKNGAGYAPRHGLPVLNPAQIALGLASPCGDEHGFVSRVLTLIEQSLYLHSGAQHVLNAWRSLRDRGDTHICLRRLLEELEQRQRVVKPWSKTANHLESAVVALRRLCDGTPLFSGCQTLSWSRRFSYSHVLRLADQLAEGIRIVVLTYLEAYLRHTASLGWRDRRLRALFCLDDSRVLVRTVAREGQASVDALMNYADLAHAAGGGVMIAVQHLGEVAPDLVSSASGLILVGPCAAEDVRRLRGRLQVTPDRESLLLHQPPFHAVCHFRSHAWPYPVPLQLAGPEYGLPPETAQRQRATATRRLFEGVRLELWKPAVEQPAPEAPSSTDTPIAAAASTLEPKLHQLLVALLDCPHLLQTELGERCGVRGREVTALRDQLQQLGYVRVHRLAGRYALWEATAEGAACVGRAFAPLPGRGAYPHRFLQTRWATSKRRAYPRVEIEFEVPGVGPVDGYAEAADGARMAVEIALAEETTERAIEKLVKFTGERCLVVVDQTAAKQLKVNLCLYGIVTLTVQELVKMTAALV